MIAIALFVAAYAVSAHHPLLSLALSSAGFALLIYGARSERNK